MTLRITKAIFGRGVSGAHEAASRRSRPASPRVEAMETRVSLSGLAASSNVVYSFNPQPDPPSRSAQIIAIL
jgi:hypothetical protein